MYRMVNWAWDVMMRWIDMQLSVHISPILWDGDEIDGHPVREGDHPWIRTALRTFQRVSFLSYHIKLWSILFFPSRFSCPFFHACTRLPLPGRRWKKISATDVIYLYFSINFKKEKNGWMGHRLDFPPKSFSGQMCLYAVVRFACLSHSLSLAVWLWLWLWEKGEMHYCTVFVLA